MGYEWTPENIAREKEALAELALKVVALRKMGRFVEPDGTVARIDDPEGMADMIERQLWDQAEGLLVGLGAR